MALVLDTLDCVSTSRPAFFRAAILAEMSETCWEKNNQVSQDRLIVFTQASWIECAGCTLPQRVGQEICLGKCESTFKNKGFPHRMCTWFLSRNL